MSLRQSGRHYRGFTLIELLVVILIISIVAGVVVLTIKNNENRQLEAISRELQQRIELAKEQALFQPAIIGLFLDRSSYQFVHYSPLSDNPKPIWQPVDYKQLGRYRLPAETELIIKTQTVSEKGQEAGPVPQIVISTNGEVTPFTIYIRKKGKSFSYVITGEADGEITRTRLS